MRPTQDPPAAELANARKLRLNAEQWQVLRALSNDGGITANDRQVAAVGRLTSNGLVATDLSGRTYLTIFGLQRLSQGR